MDTKSTQNWIPIFFNKNNLLISFFSFIKLKLCRSEYPILPLHFLTPGLYPSVSPLPSSPFPPRTEKYQRLTPQSPRSFILWARDKLPTSAQFVIFTWEKSDSLSPSRTTQLPDGKETPLREALLSLKAGSREGHHPQQAQTHESKGNDLVSKTILLTTLNARYHHSSFGLRYLLAQLEANDLTRGQAQLL